MLKLEAGKRYWRRDGGVSPVVCANDAGDVAYPFRAGNDTFRSDGRFNRWQEHENDLVREYTEPQPLEWKRGIPTEEECRECWIVTGRYGKLPDSFGKVYCPAEVQKPSETFCEKEWYLPLRINPVEPPKPKTKTVTQRQYFNSHGSELWTHMEVLETFWTPSTLTRTQEVPCE